MAKPGTATVEYLHAMSGGPAKPSALEPEPERYKRYPRAARMQLPWTSTASADAAATGVETVGELLRDLLGLVRLDWSLPVDASGRVSAGPPRLLVGRAGPSGGALYPIEAYLAVGRHDGLPAGLYHYDPVHHALETLRGGDHRGALRGLLSAPTTGRAADAVLLLTAAFWRTMFRYGEFGYRLQCQETGILLAQALASAERLGLAAEVHTHLADVDVNRLLGLEPEAEGTLGAVSVSLPGAAPLAGGDGLGELAGRPTPAPAGATPPIVGRAECAAALYATSRIEAAAGCAQARFPAARRLGVLPPLVAPSTRATPDPPAALATRATADPPAGIPMPLPATAVRLGDGVERRASPYVGFRPLPMPVEELGAILAAAGDGYPGDLPGCADGPVTTVMYLLALRIPEVPAGVYRYQCGDRTLYPVADESAVASIVGGPVRPNSRLALRGAAAALLCAGDPLAGVRAAGDRWYQLQQAEVGFVTHRATLAAAALGYGSRIHSDVTNPVTDEALGLSGTPWRSLCCLAIGVAARTLTRRTPRPATAGVPAAREVVATTL